MKAVRSMALIFPLLAGCAATSDAPIRYPQNPDEFLSTYNWGGWFQNVDRMTVDRPLTAVVADMRQYAKQCLDIKINKKRAARYALDKYGTKPSSEPVTYNTRVGRLKSGSTALSVQEWNGVEQKGAPPGGPYTLVAEARAAGKSNTELKIHHLAKPFLSDPLKRWVANDRRDCPGL